MRIEDNILKGEGGDIKFVGSPNHSDGMSPLYLVLHYTAGSSLDGAVSWLTNPKAKASAHLVIGRGGEVVQLVRFDKKAWHAGVSLWGKLKNMNNFSIGIELVNQGKLVRKGGKWVDYSDRVVADSDVIEAVHKNERYPAGWQ
ncbi:MAG TPA: N-acetylmuramoyl-L-alanine amidase, partial [Magnetococcales bacterium]|nr:N-acetylmuramoyl-L-alanine amidase [Magnetococcales bacterium]